MNQQAWLVWDTETKELVRVVWSQEPDTRVGEWKSSYRAMKWTPPVQSIELEPFDEMAASNAACNSPLVPQDLNVRFMQGARWQYKRIARAALEGAP